MAFAWLCHREQQSQHQGDHSCTVYAKCVFCKHMCTESVIYKHVLVQLNMFKVMQAVNPHFTISFPCMLTHLVAPAMCDCANFGF